MCPRIRLNFLIFLCLALYCSAKSDEVLDLTPEEDQVVDDYVKTINRNGCTSREQYFGCPGAPTCQKTCSNLNGVCVTDGNCVPGCHCRSGFVRDVFTNECIPIKQCPGTSCPRNEFFNTCETRTECERACAERNTPCDPAIACSTGCQCKSGFFRDPISRSCVRERDCNAPSPDTPKCPRNEHFEGCGSSCKETCPGNQNCEIECKSGCFCDAGLVRIKGRCVDPKRCMKSCPFAEKPDCIVPCSDSCDPQACVQTSVSKSRFNECSKNPSNIESKMCACIKGFKRHSNGTCIVDDECPKCPEGEELTLSVACEEHCDGFACNTQDRTPTWRCSCKNGKKRQFTADSSPGQCVDQIECKCLDTNANFGCRNICHNDCQVAHTECEDGASNDGCVPSCYCIDDHRLVNGTCKPFNECECNGPNEDVKPDGNRCLEMCTCELSLPTGPGCFCKDNYVRVNGVCVTRSSSCDDLPPV